MTNILDTFRFDFSNRERDANRLNNFLDKYGYPNLKVDLSEDYDGLWKLVNIRNNSIVWVCYHSGFLTIFEDDGIIKMCFDSKEPNSSSKNIFFEKVTKVSLNTDSIVIQYAADRLGITVEQLRIDALS